MKRKRKLTIELTSLLDVILILMFVVMGQSQKMTEDLSSGYQELSSSCEELRQENKELKQENGKIEDELTDALARLDKGDREELLTQLEQAENRAEALEYLTNVVNVVNVNLSNSASGAVRCLSYGCADEEASVYTFSSDGERRVILDRMKVALDRWISDTMDTDGAMLYIVFSYNKDNVYFTDRNSVQKAIETTTDGVDTGRVRFQYIYE